MLPPPTPSPADVVMRLEKVSRTFQMGELQVHALVDFTLDIYAAE
ncbi:MAG: ABC transporter ATP-binding protein, partial [Planctomycetales bacterium]|nr:ABC transporter ATP-binding protein [Planctomycetales bacterium]